MLDFMDLDFINANKNTNKKRCTPIFSLCGLPTTLSVARLKSPVGHDIASRSTAPQPYI